MALKCGPEGLVDGVWTVDTGYDKRVKRESDGACLNASLFEGENES